MIQEMHERLKKANERRNCGADDEIASLREALAAKDAEIERLRADAALGAAVRAMPEYCDLYRLKNTWEVSRQFGGPRGFGETPEDALRRARLMKEAEK